MVLRRDYLRAEAIATNVVTTGYLITGGDGYRQLADRLRDRSVRPLPAAVGGPLAGTAASSTEQISTLELRPVSEIAPGEVHGPPSYSEVRVVSALPARHREAQPSSLALVATA